MSKITLHCHREGNFVVCISGYAGTYYTCDLVINKTMTIDLCPDNFNVCQKEVNKGKYYDCSGKKLKTTALFLDCAEKRWNVETFASFCTRCKDSWEDCREHEGSRCDD